MRETRVPESSLGTVPSGAWLALVALTLVNLLNYVDRMVVPAVGESIVRSSLAPSDAEFGFLASAFILVYMVTAPFFGVAGDRRVRPPLMAAGVALWSLATAAGALAPTYGALLASRATVGIGEAAYSAIAPALLADLFPARLRGRVFAIFFAATPVGSALGYVIGGLVDRRAGWRAALLVVGLPGLLLAAVLLLLRDPAAASRRARDGHATAVGGHFRSYLVLARSEGYRLVVLGYAAYTFALGGIAVWMPIFLERVRGMPRVGATVRLGEVLVVTGFVGTFAGGWVGDWLLRRTAQGYLWLSGATALAAAPLAFVALTSRGEPVYWTALIAAELLLFASTGPVNSAIVDAAPLGARAAAMAGGIFVIHILGDVPSPTLIGVLSDAGSLARAVLIIPAAIAVSGVIWLAAARRGSGVLATG